MKHSSPVCESATTAHPDPDLDHYKLRLYVAGQSPKSLRAFDNLRQICQEYLAGRYEIEIIDLESQPERARRDAILALPTLVRRLPPPVKKIIGDLSNSERVLMGLDLVESQCE